jgi:hypothetical protein
MIFAEQSNIYGFALNPFGENIILSREIINNIANGDKRIYITKTHTIENATQVLLGTPSDYPHDLVKAVTAYLKNSEKCKKLLSLIDG